MDYGYNNQYSTTSYGAQGGAGGGGFMQNASQEATGKNSKAYGNDTLRPVTIKQLNDAEQPHPDADFKIDGADITQITFVGQIRNVSAQATNHTYKFDDGTGTIEVKKWIDADISGISESDKAPQSLGENMYARVFGRLKAFNNKRHLGAQFIQPVTDHNEIQYHLLEATAVHLQLTRGAPAEQGGNTNGNNGQAQRTNGHDGNYTDVVNGRGRILPAGLSGSAKRVYNCINSTPQSNEGLHMQEIATRLNMDLADVSKAGQELLDQGMVYTTVDDSTWALLDDL